MTHRLSSLPDTPKDRVQRRTAAVLLIGIGVCLLLLGVRLIHINTALRDRLLSIVNAQYRGRSTLPARRGMILDCRGRVVAATKVVSDVFVDPSRVDDVDDLANALAARVNLSARNLAAKIRSSSGRRYVLIAPRVDEVTADAVRAMEHRAVGLSDRALRTYPLGDSMGHVLGFVGRDGAGLEGMELDYDRHLRGRAGRRITIHDARRRALYLSSAHAPEPPIDGGHVVLTLDAEIQRIAEQALADTVAQFEAKSAVAIVMAPGSGDLLAMAGVPSFDPNHAGTVPPETRRNRAITDPTEPGSAFKPFIVCAALDGDFVSTTEQIDCHDGVHYFGRRRVTDTSPHGLLDLKGILTHSSNIGMGIIAHRMGNEVLYETARRFGFGTPTGVDFPGEAPGFVRPLHRWTSYSTNAVCIGYEIAVTPLQLATAFAAIVNDGLWVQPRLVKTLLAADGEAIRRVEPPRIERRVASPATARYVAGELMVSVVENGGGRRAQVGPYKVLGKTGTAKLTYRDRAGYEPGAYVSTFVGAAPASYPQVVVLVMVRRPNAAIGYYGSLVAAPAAGRILAATLAYLDVPTDEPVATAGL